MAETVFKTEKTKKVEFAYLVGIETYPLDSTLANEHLNELRELVDTMGLKIKGSEVVKLRESNAKFYIGSGKVEEIGIAAKESQADCIVVDFELSPSQQRNWEATCQICVIDRQEVILDIFSARATTREAVIQVALARMEYSLPRLTRAWTHLSRQSGAGGIGGRGEGETQLEADRRIVQNRISYLKEELKEVSKHRDTQRAKREKSSMTIAAIAGYTNVGKSSLLNVLSGASVFVEDKLFATLDPTTRIVGLPGNQSVLLTDTVGFIRKLPHNLVEAFKSTLEEVVVSDFIIHVLDISSNSVDEHYETTKALLKDLKSIDKPIITVFNKTDKLNDPVTRARLRSLHPEALFISIKTNEGIDLLLAKIEEVVSRNSHHIQIAVPPDKYDLISKIYKHCKVIGTVYDGDLMIVSARVPYIHKKIFEKYIV